MLRRISLYVIGAHLFLLLFLSISPRISPPVAAKPIAIRMYTPPPPRPTQTKKAAQNPGSPARPAKPPAKKPAKKKEEPAKKTAPKKPTPAPASPKPKPKSKGAVAKREEPKSEPIADLPDLPDLPVPTLSPTPMPFAPAPAAFGFVQEQYDPIISYLHHALRLPDYGEVKVSITIRPDGTVAKVVVLKAESANNKAYLERELPSLVFPRDVQRLSGDRERVFVVVFCNEV
jgi:outer membrane biosynthesis protein TonB